jgi:ankyrin repeat protein
VTTVLHQLTHQLSGVIQTASDNGSTPAHASAFRGHENSLQALIAAKADVNAKDVDGLTPAMSACDEDCLACLQLLVDNKADVSVSVLVNATLFNMQ